MGSYGYDTGGFIGYACGTSGSNKTKELVIKDCKNYGDVNGNRNDAGGFVGELYGYSSVELHNNINNGNITGAYETGGLVGYLTYNTNTSIKGCTNNGNLDEVSSYGGGLIGYISNSHTYIEECNNTGTISTDSYGGGLVGYVSGIGINIFNCNNSGDVIKGNNSSNPYLAGILAYDGIGSKIEYSYNTGNIGESDKSGYYSGGILACSSNNNTLIDNCYNLGNIYNAQYCGGIFGGERGTITNSYNKGNIVINSNYSKSYIYTGGIVGNGYGVVIHKCYNTGNISVIKDPCSTYYVGGIIGQISQNSGIGSISYSYNKGTIYYEKQGEGSDDGYIGGISGSTYNVSVGYCYNTGNITANVKSDGGYIYIGGISGSGAAGCCYNTGDIQSIYTSDSSNSYNVYIGGVIGNAGTVSNSYNTGKITNVNIAENSYGGKYIGGVVGYGNATVLYSYNTGDIDNNNILGSSSYVYVGGIGGNVNTVTDAYNTGNITNDVNSDSTSNFDVYVGGIAGSGSNSGATVVHVYNTGDVINLVRNEYIYAKTGPIVANGQRTTNRYYLDSIQVVGPNIYDDPYTTKAVTDEELKSDEIYQTLHNTSAFWKKVDGAYPILEFPVYTESEESAVEITIADQKMEYDITAEVGENSNGVRVGGFVSGEYNSKYIQSLYRKYIETVSHGDDSTKTITITPDSGYEVADITIDGEHYSFVPNEVGIVTIPAGYFENVTKNYNVIATFAPANEILVINKVDDDNNPVEGAVFDIHQIEDREVPTDAVKNLVQDGQQSTYVDTTTTHNDILGTLTNNGTYYFTTQSDGKLKANNLAANTTADSYMKIDLTDSSKSYRVMVNYSNSMSSSGRCTGLVAVTNSTDALTTSSSTGRIVYSTSTITNASSLYSQVLQAGNVYYLHFAQIVNASYSLSSGQGFTINSISVYEDCTVPAYTFENVDGKYVSNNSETIPVGTMATGYIPVDLRGKTGKYNIVVNSEINGQNHNGYIVVNDSISRVTSSYGGITRSGTSAASNNYVTVEGGKMYYVHVVHYNYGSTTNIYHDNSFTINSVSITLNSSDFTNIYGLVTGKDGKIRSNLKYGKYVIVEQSAPEEYIKNEENKIHVIGEGTDNNVTIVNNKKRIVKVHYYLHGTGPEFDKEPEELLADKNYYGVAGETYTTTPILQIGKYNLITENGEYVIPENASGNFSEEPIDIYYYYEKEKASYNVHYIYGGVEDESALITDEAEIDSQITTYESKDKEGYIFKEVINLPLTITDNPEKNNIYVIYDKDEFEYKVKYYFEDENGEYQEKQDLEETNSALFESEVSTYEDKAIDGYKLNRAVALDENGNEKDLPLIIGIDESKNIIKVYYERDNFSYTVHYFYQGIENPLMKYTKQAKFGSSITSQDIEDKNIEGYKLDRIKKLDENEDEQDLPLVIGSDEDKNVINVYYVKDNFGYTIEYYYDNVKDDSKTVTGTAEFESVIESYEDKVIDGYKLDKTENKPMTITSNAANNVMKVYYIKDNFSYSIEYYYDNVKDESKTVTGNAEFGSIIESYEDKVIDGYKLDKTENKPMTITSTAANNIMKVYYIKDNFSYSIEYYYDNVKDDSKTVTGSAEFGSVIEAYEDKNIDGYKLDKTENKPMTITSNAANNVMKVFYVKDTFGYEVHYYYEGVEDTSKAETGLSAVFGTEISEYTDKNIPGYKLEKTRALDENGQEGPLPLVIKSDKTKNRINIYYIKDDLGYEVHYFYDGVENTTLKEGGNSTIGERISDYTDKCPDGYKLEKVKALNDNGEEADLPLIIKVDESKNIINVYYIKDSFDYTIEYYYDNVKDESKTVTGTAEFGSVIEAYEDKNIDGYKLDKTDNKPMTITSTAANNVMKVYYVKDSFDYTIEYYYDNIKDESKTVTDTAEFGSVIEAYEDKVIDGYKLDKTENKPMTITSNTENNIMKVYYAKDNFDYTVEYYYNGVIDNTKTETFSAEFGSTISDYESKPIDGYKFSTAKALDENGVEKELPLVIKSDSSKNKIRVYYIKDNFGYSIEYYYDNVKDESKTVTGTVEFGSVIDNYEDKVIDGYKFDKTENKPMTITSNAANNVMKVYYVKDSFSYSIEYYYDNVKDESKTVTDTAVFGSVVDNYEDKAIDGYKFDKTENKPMTITSNAENNIMKVFYIKDDFKYTVHYFYEGVEDESKKIEETAKFGTEITEVPDKNITGYKKQKTEGLPLTISSNSEENVVNVYYIKDELGYTVHYFYDNVEDENQMINENATFGTTIESVPDKNKTGYKHDKTEGLPLTISANPEENIVNVYYVKDSFGYSVHYFYDNVEDESKKIEDTKLFGEQITEVPDKNIEGYEYSRTEGLPLTISANPDENVVNVFYVKKAQGTVIVEYVDNLTGETIAESTIMTGDVGSPFTVTRIDVPGHKLDIDNLPDESGTYKDTPQTVTYKYIKLRPYELLVRYTSGDNDEAKIGVRFGDTFIDEYTTNGELKIADIELTDLETEVYTVYETETPEFCKTIVSEEKPAVVELKGILNTEKNKYEFVPTYDAIEGFNVIIDEENSRVIFDITTKKEEKYDLAVKKFITNINGTEITNRAPEVTVGEDGKITYKTNDTIEKTANKQNITYTIRMYNESEIRAKGKRVIEYIPDGLVFVPENEINTMYGWEMYRISENGNLIKTNNIEEAKVVATDYLDGKEIGAINVAEKQINSLDVKVVFVVDESKLTSKDRIIENKVKITPNKNDDNTDNDETTEKAYVQFFDLSIEKYIEKVTVNTNGNETTEEVGYDKKGELVKVDVKGSEVNNTKLTVTYGLVVKNIGEIPGYATEITDYVPENFKLMEDEKWTLNGNTAVSTALKDTELNPGESTILEITFEWNLAEGNIGERRNEAEITAYANEYDAEDITKDNKDGEDLLVSIKTGSEVIKIVEMIAMYTAVFALGVYFVKRKVVIRMK